MTVPSDEGDLPLRNPTTGICCCARVVSGHVAAPPSSAMNSRRFLGSPPQAESRTLPHHRVRKPTCIARANVVRFAPDSDRIADIAEGLLCADIVAK
jgi:hypothetical protein